MPNNSTQLEATVRKVKDYSSLLDMLASQLDWEVDTALGQDEMTFEWTAEDLSLSQSSAHRLKGGLIRQLRFDRIQPPWGVFFVEFVEEKLYRSALRQILRGLVPKARRESHLPAWKHDQLLFICSTSDYQRFTFAHFRADKSHNPRLATFGWERGDRNIRTLCEFNLPALEWPKDEQDKDAWLASWAKAFDKEPLTRDFFKRFDAAIDTVRDDLIKFQGLEPSEAYTRAQLLLLRMIFTYFLQNRGWLNQERDYLLANFNSLRGRPKDFSYYHDFLEKLFWSLSSPPNSGGGRFPGIPFLNGGLFDDDEFDPGPRRKKNSPPLNVSNSTFAHVFDEFLEKFNFTVREDTPLNQEVAVDPEMLGKVFESIVLHAEAADPEAVAPDKRKATGSYYTPRIVVHFICQEALRQYLIGQLPGEKFTSRLADIMKIDASEGLDAQGMQHLRELLRPEDAQKLLPHLSPKCCDPAVGSGAFPVGLLHELVNLQRVVQTAANGYVDPVKKKGSDWLHETKEQVIQDCLYGVDIQQQAIEICQLRLWLSLVVDYHLGIDPFTASRDQFVVAIERMSQLPNLEMNFRRGDSLHDYVSGQPLIIEREATQRFRKDIEYIHDRGLKLHKAKKAEQKRKLRIEILERRLDLSRRALEAELEALKADHSQVADRLFVDETKSRAELRSRIEQETGRINGGLRKIADDEKELDRLKRSEFDPRFYQRLRKLEGADFDSPFNFAWQIDFADIFAQKKTQPVATVLDEFIFVNEIDEQGTLPYQREEVGGFDIVVGNPPFVTARNPKKRQLYRERWKRVCSGKYLLVCPFFEMSFGLLRPGGELGFIVSNAFGKREFGKPLVQNFFPTVDLQKVMDCSGLMFPGHGTPTCIIFARNATPKEKSDIRVAVTLPGGGDLRTPPEESLLWSALENHHDDRTYLDSRIAVTMRPRSEMAVWPWNLEPGAEATRGAIESQNPDVLRRMLAEDVGFDVIFGMREVFVGRPDFWRRAGLGTGELAEFAEGDVLRNYTADYEYCLFPYDPALAPSLSDKGRRLLAPWRARLEVRPQLGGLGQVAFGLEWFEYYRFTRRGQGRSLDFPEIATHAHFVYSEASRVFTQTAPVVKLPTDAGEEKYDLAAALLNSSSVLFWLKQVCFSKRESEEGATDTYFVFAGGRVQQLPVPEAITSTLEGTTTNPLADAMTRLSRECWARGKTLSKLALAKLFDLRGEAYHDWNSRLPGYVESSNEIAVPFYSASHLRANLCSAIEIRQLTRCEMIARQEEMDWLAYEAYGLIDPTQAERLRSLTSAAFGKYWDAAPELSIDREERPFALWSQSDGDRDQACALIPSDWSEGRKQLWRARLQVIATNEHIRRIEQPVYKRRWDEQWKVGARWQCGRPAYDQEFIDAFTWWLSEKAEWWLEYKSGGPASFDQWCAALWQDQRIQAAWTVAAETVNRLDAWKEQQKKKPGTAEPRPDASFQGFVRFLKAAVKEQTVPEGIPFAVPYDKIPKATANVKKIRGKLNVPRERFWITEEGLYRAVSFDELIAISGGNGAGPLPSGSTERTGGGGNRTFRLTPSPPRSSKAGKRDAIGSDNPQTTGARSRQSGSGDDRQKIAPVAAALHIDDLETSDLMTAVREVFSGGAELDREAAIKEVAHAAGFNRTGSRIAEDVDSALITAVRRGIIKNDRGILSIDCRDIGQYPRNLLVTALVAATGYAWTERERAIKAAARYLGFRRTGSSIHDAFKSAINSAIRRGLIGTDRKMIRKSREPG